MMTDQIENIKKDFYKVADKFGFEKENLNLYCYCLFLIASRSDINNLSNIKRYLSQDDVLSEVFEHNFDTKVWNELLRLAKNYTANDFKNLILDDDFGIGDTLHGVPDSLLEISCAVMGLNYANLSPEQNYLLRASLNGNIPSCNFGTSNRVSYSVTNYIRNKILDTENFDDFTPSDESLNNDEENAPALSPQLESMLNYILASGIKQVGIMSLGQVTGFADRNLRNYFLKNNLIETVIELPQKLFPYLTVKLALVILSQNNQCVRMIDATHIYTTGRGINILSEENIKTILSLINQSEDSDIAKSVSYDEIKAHNTILCPTTYLYSFTDENTFSEVIKDISRGISCTSDQLDEMMATEKTNYRYLAQKSIQNGRIISDLPFLKEISKKHQEKYCLKNGQLVISRFIQPLKIAVAENIGDEKILVSGNLLIITLDTTKTTPYYIKAFLESSEGEKHLTQIAVGARQPLISAENLKELRIPLPDISKQTEIADKYKEIEDKLNNLMKERETLFR